MIDLSEPTSVRLSLQSRYQSFFAVDPEIITFGGTSSDECELFVSAIRRRSLAEGKYGDNEWIAYFASSCFVGEALYWYEGLDENVQSDWGNLRQAILERFGQRSQSQSISHR